MAIFVLLTLISSGCASIATPTLVQEVVTEEISPTQTPVSNNPTLVQEVATEEISPTQTLTSSSLKYYPLDTQTGNPEIDRILAAVASGEPQQLIALFGYTTTACKTVNALGGPPPCRTGEADGTLVKVLPVLGSEGTFIYADEVDKFPGLTVIGLHSIFKNSATAYTEEYYPAGEFTILLIANENRPAVALRIGAGKIVRIDFLFQAATIQVIITRDALSFILEPK